MNTIVLSGEQALAYGALYSGVKLVASYPGSPGAGTVETLIGLAKEHSLYVEWSSNEKVAIEMGIGASIAGRRALICTKSVGMNLMVDPLMAFNLTPTRGGLVILLGDDPGAYGSQNDQDTRMLAQFLEIPFMEPASPAESYSMIKEAFVASEKFHTAVVLRITRSFSQQNEPVSISEQVYREARLGFEREPWRFFPAPRNAVQKHEQLHTRLAHLGLWADDLPFNRLIGGGNRGVLAAGFAYRKFVDVLGKDTPHDLRVLKLSSLYPLPDKMLAIFLSGCQQVLVLEENEPFVETQLKVLAHDLELGTRVLGKLSGHIPREGELYRWQIHRALSDIFPGFSPAENFLQDTGEAEIPKKENFCAGNNYGLVLDALEEAAQSLNQELVLVVDPGCLVAFGERLDAKYAIGSAIGVADGLEKSGIKERAVALFGDSSFFHTSLPALCNAAHNRSKILMVVLDNSAAASTGFQPTPGIGVDAMGRPVPALDIERIASACGVNNVHSVEDNKTELIKLFQEIWKTPELALVIVRMKSAHNRHEVSGLQEI